MRAIEQGRRSQRLTVRLARLPAYALLKTKTQSMLNPDDIEGDVRRGRVARRLWQIGFGIERIEGGKVALLLPGSPDPWSDSVCIAEEERISPLIGPWRPSPRYEAARTGRE